MHLEGAAPGAGGAVPGLRPCCHAIYQDERVLAAIGLRAEPIEPGLPGGTHVSWLSLKGCGASAASAGLPRIASAVRAGAKKSQNPAAFGQVLPAARSDRQARVSSVS